MFLIIWLIFIFIVSAMPLPVPQTDLTSDKIVHAVLYGLTAIFFFRYLVSRTTKMRAMFSSIVAASVYGFFMELIQYFIPQRAFSAGDIFANTAGAFVFSILYTKWSGR
jgi:VanZ family protein